MKSPKYVKHSIEQHKPLTFPFITIILMKCVESEFSFVSLVTFNDKRKSNAMKNNTILYCINQPRVLLQ